MIPWVLVHGPYRYSGLNIPDFYTEQLVSQLAILIRHGQAIQDTASMPVHVATEALKLKCSICSKFSEIPVI